jgi:FlgN protein
MKETINAFIILLQKQEECFGQLLELKRRESILLATADLKELEQSNRETEAVMSGIEMLESARLDAQEKLAGIFDVPTQDLTLTRLCELLPKQYVPMLKDIGDNLRTMTANLDIINRQNALVIQGSQQFLHETLESLLCTGDRQLEAYDAGGSIPENKSRRPALMDRRA